MAFIDSNSYDALLADIRDNAEKLVICSQEPSTYPEAATTYKLATKATPSVAAPSNKAGGGREIIFAAITDGTVNSSGTGTHWAVIDDTNSRLKASGALTSSQALTASNPFTLTSFAIGVPPAV